jgi:hypothetical protein
MRKSIVRGVAAVAAASGILALTACGPAPWEGPSDDRPTQTATATVAPPVPNDLSSGSTRRDLTAGAVTAAVDYWSDLAMDRWTHEAVKPVSISMTTTITPNDGQKVYLQKASMVAVPANATDTFDALAPQTDASSVSPGYLVLSPYSYSQTFNVGPVPAEATFVTLRFTYDFLVQTTPTSNEYAKQTASDTLTVAIAGQPAADDE